MFTLIVLTLTIIAVVGVVVKDYPKSGFKNYRIDKPDNTIGREPIYDQKIKHKTWRR